MYSKILSTKYEATEKAEVILVIPCAVNTTNDLITTDILVILCGFRKMYQFSLKFHHLN